MQGTGKIVVAAIFVLGLQGSAFAGRGNSTADSAVSIFDGKLTPRRLARIAKDVQRRDYSGSDRYQRVVGGPNYAVQARSIVGNRPGNVLGLVTLDLQERLVSETILSGRGSRGGAAVPPRTVRQCWAPLKLRLMLVQPSPEGNRWLTAQVNVGPRQATGRVGELFNVGVTSLRGDEVPSSNLAGHYLSLVRQVLLEYVPRVGRLARK